MTDQMVAGGQGEALKAMEKSIPMGRVGRPEGNRLCVFGSAAMRRATT